MRTAISRIQRCIRELQDFDPTTVRDRSDPRIKSLEVSINQVLNQTFGSDGPERNLYAAAANLDRAPLRMGAKTPLQEVVQGLTRGKEEAIDPSNGVRHPH
jgi:predicted dienelactone hydrolase